MMVVCDNINLQECIKKSNTYEIYFIKDNISLINVMYEDFVEFYLFIKNKVHFKQISKWHNTPLISDDNKYLFFVEDIDSFNNVYGTKLDLETFIFKNVKYDIDYLIRNYEKTQMIYSSLSR